MGGCMTPEQTLDWLAQKHFDQCREDRPVQHWIRKMKSELPPQLEERYFCQRCGKPVNLTTIHTCTPPRENT